MLDKRISDPPKDHGASAPLAGEAPRRGADAGDLRRPLGRFAVLVVLLTACFVQPLFGLARYSWHSDFFSYILLIPFITAYLIWLDKAALPGPASPSWKGAAIAALGGLAILIGWEAALHSGWKPGPQDHLTAMTASYLFFVVAGAFLVFGSTLVRAVAFPTAMLIFMIPMPEAMLSTVEMFFQQTSAATAAAFLSAAGMPVFREDILLHLPDYSLLVTHECSGIHSTMVLLITSLLAGHLFLRSNWRRALLVAVVVPLAIARNGFRIFVIGELCVRVSHSMIDSPIHRKGGPLFFALSLIPFFILLYLLRKSELRGSKTGEAAGKI